MRLVILVVFLSAACWARSVPSSLHQLPNAEKLVDGRVVELDFTSTWFANASFIDRTLPCPIPERQLPTFGLGYQSVSDQMDTIACWVEHQHRLTNNLDVDDLRERGAELVHASGVSELLLASIVTSVKMFEKDGHHQRPVVTMHAAPYYSVLKMHCKSHVLRGLVDWMEPVEVSSHSLQGRPLIVVAVTPTNPGGSVEQGLLAHCVDDPENSSTLRCFSSPTRVISDHSFLWPCTVAPQLREGSFKWPIRAQRESALLFGLAKMTGHSGVRYGWSWMPNATFAKTMRETLWEMGLTLSAASLSHASIVLAATSASSELSFHDWCASKMDERWKKLAALPLFKEQCFELQSEPRSSFTVIHCKSQPLCSKFFEGHGVLVSSGEQFGLSSSQVRVALGLHDVGFEQMLFLFQNISCSSRP